MYMCLYSWPLNNTFELHGPYTCGFFFYEYSITSILHDITNFFLLVHFTIRIQHTTRITYKV